MIRSEEVAQWFTKHVPDNWFEGALEVSVDREEILVVGTLKEPGEGEESAHKFRDETREERIKIALRAQAKFGRKVSWGVVAGGERYLFRTASVPVMTRLAMPERKVLDLLVSAGVAGSRSEALAWCVRLVGRNEKDWIQKLVDALKHVEEARKQGPSAA